MKKVPFVTKEQIEEIAKTYPTPFHLYDEKGLRENAKRLYEAFSWNPGYKEYFAVKATPNPFLMSILKEYGVHATFFHIGYTITQENADILKRQITEGHAIANHSLSHNFNLLYPGRVPNQSQIVSEVNQTMANFQAILGKDFKTRIFRYPGGHMSWQGLESTDQALAKQGVQWIDWNMLCGDAEPLSVRPTTSESMMAYMDGSQKYFPETTVTNGAIVIHTQRLKSDPGGNLLS